jgi:histidyl-tRNA synthetase
MKHSMEALGINDFRIHFSHRGVFNTLLEELEISDKSVDILRTVDKLSKLGREKVASMLAESIGAGKAETVLSFTEPRDSLQETLAKMEDVLNTECNAITRLKAIIENLRELGVEDYFFLNPGITRGLDYYTGIVYETFLTTIPEIGSICSGGRYNDLASLYTKEKLPGVGSSIGLDRLMAALQQLKQETKRYSPIQLIILCLDDALMGYYHSLAEQLREAGVNCEVYPEQKKLAKQFSYAEKKQIPYALICGEDERASGTLSWKNLETRESREQLSLRDIIDLVKSSR